MQEKPRLLRPAVCLFACYTLYGAALVPLYHFFYADIVLQNTFWFDLIDGAQQWLEIVGMSLCFGYLIDGIHRFTVRACRALYLLVGGALLFKYVLSLASLVLLFGEPLSLSDAVGSALSLGIELALCAVVVLLAALRIPRAAAAQKARAKAAETLGKTDNAPSSLLPFRRPFARDNVLQTTALLAMILLAVIRVLLWVVNDVAFALFGFAFTAADIPVTLLYWLILILVPAALGYFLILFILQKRAK